MLRCAPADKAARGGEVLQLPAPLALAAVVRLGPLRAGPRALAAAHDVGILHRDLKPGNIMLRRDDTIALIDFGLARSWNDQTVAGQNATTGHKLVGTPHYSQPEQLQGKPLTPAADVYSLGVILYSLVCGHSPYDGGTEPSLTTERIVCELEPPPPSHAIRRFSTAFMR